MQLSSGFCNQCQSNLLKREQRGNGKGIYLPKGRLLVRFCSLLYHLKILAGFPQECRLACHLSSETHTSKINTLAQVDGKTYGLEGFQAESSSSQTPNYSTCWLALVSLGLDGWAQGMLSKTYRDPNLVSHLLPFLQETSLFWCSAWTTETPSRRCNA